MFSCYIIYSKKLDRYYIGYTENIEQRLIQHNSGVSTFTAKAQDRVLVYEELFESREAASKREREIKKKKSRNHIAWLIKTKNIKD
ncbi:MAG: GIY-YIG nuclease family protein [Bacteroidota bacterium]|nr:GIY-YIG nuclease family protein [Bacteroidota bacterium]